MKITFQNQTINENDNRTESNRTEKNSWGKDKTWRSKKSVNVNFGAVYESGQLAVPMSSLEKEENNKGKALMELLKQPLSHPLSMHEQVLTLCMATDGVFDKIPTRQVKQYQKDILDFMDLKHPEIGKEIEQTKALSDELRQKIKDAAAEFAAEQ